VTVFEMNLP